MCQQRVDLLNLKSQLGHRSQEFTKKKKDRRQVQTRIVISHCNALESPLTQNVAMNTDGVREFREMICSRTRFQRKHVKN